MAQTVNYVDLSKLADDLNQAAQQSGSSINEVLQQIGNEIAAEAQDVVPVRTGNLKNSIAVVAGQNQVYVGPDVSQAPYAAFVEYGTEPHEITPKKARVLAFRVQGQLVYAKKVQHPGTRPQPYMRPAVERWVGRLGERAADAGVHLITGKEKRAS
jgi:HK97 gp10 family phage protein